MIGFNIDPSWEIAFNKEGLKAFKVNPSPTWWSKVKFSLMRFTKYLINPTFAHFSFQQETQSTEDPLQPYLSNVLNPLMNNVEAIDFTMQDWIKDNDVCISRRASEFPRMNTDFQNHFSRDRPWGEQDPVQFDVLDHPIHHISSLKPGVWYYGGIPGTDHLDLCGFPETFSPFRTLIEEEFRHEVWRTIFIRAKMLDFDN